MNYKTMLKGALALSLSLIVGEASAYTATTNDAPAVYTETFESSAVDTPISAAAFHALDAGDNNAPYGWLAPEGDESKVISANNGLALQLNTDAGTLTNQFQKSVRDSLNAGIADAGAYFETEVKFVPSDTLDAGIAGGQDATKFAIYAYANEDATPPTTNLVVFHKYFDTVKDDYDYTNEQFGAVNCDAYTKLRVEMKKVLDPSTAAQINVFSVKVGNEPALTSDLAIDGIWFLTAENGESAANRLVSSLNFKGTGEIDNIKAGTISIAESYTIDWTGSENVVVSNGTEEVSGTTGNYAADTVLTFYATVGLITNANDVALDPAAASWSYTVGTADAAFTVLAGEEPVAPTGFAEGNTYGSVTLTAAQATWLNSFNNYDAIDAALKTDASGLEKAYLLNVNPLTGDGTLTVTAITVGADVRVTVAIARTEGESAVTGKKINGTLKLFGTADLGTAFAELASATISDDDFSEGDTATATFSGTGAKFFKAVIE